jgi:sucrose phosphorylase
MLVVGAFPQTFANDDQDSVPLRDLREGANAVLPSEAVLHLLPFTPSDGDWGFAAGHWYEVEPTLGEWADVKAIGRDRRTVVDGIYNHVGISHPIAQAFLKAPRSHLDSVYAYAGADPGFEARSPRGGSAIREWMINEERWFLWQTFNEFSIDLRLDSPSIRNEVVRHLRFLARAGIWGVRLDAAAYYAKPTHPGDSQIHTVESHRLAREVAALVQGEGLAAIAQLDCDEHGSQYFPSLDYGVPIVDYSYAAHLALAMLRGDGRGLEAHLRETAALQTNLIRSPRTHDGVLLRSGLLSEVDRVELVCRAEAWGIPARSINGGPYELNCSLPYLLGYGLSDELRWRRICAAAAISAFVPGWCWLYLPMLLDHIPERAGVPTSDPRSLNRLPIPRSQWQAFEASGRRGSMRALLAILAGLNSGPHAAHLACPPEFNGSIIVVDRPTDAKRLVVNLGPEGQTAIKSLGHGRLLYPAGASEDWLEPFGFGIWSAEVTI